MISPSTHMYTLQEVADELGVGFTTVKDWVYGTEDADPALDSFNKVKGRRVSLEDLTRFVLANTVRARRPKWLTPEVESKFRGLMREMVKAEVLSLQSTVHSQKEHEVAA